MPTGQQHDCDSGFPAIIPLFQRTVKLYFDSAAHVYHLLRYLCADLDAERTVHRAPGPTGDTEASGNARADESWPASSTTGGGDGSIDIGLRWIGLLSMDKWSCTSPSGAFRAELVTIGRC